MNLKILLPDKVFLNCGVVKVIAESVNGHFCLLPRHVDFVAALVPGLLAFETSNGTEQFLAIDEGILVKCGDDVLISTRTAAGSSDLGELRNVIRDQFEVLDEREKLARSAAARLEAGLVRRFLDLEKQSL